MQMNSNKYLTIKRKFYLCIREQHGVGGGGKRWICLKQDFIPRRYLKAAKIWDHQQ
jgi:hypothetical protein